MSRLRLPKGRALFNIGHLGCVTHTIAFQDDRDRPRQTVRPSGNPSGARSASPIFLQNSTPPVFARLIATCMALAPRALATVVQRSKRFVPIPRRWRRDRTFIWRWAAYIQATAGG